MAAMLSSILVTARWLAGPLVWAAHFLTVYASESLICSRGGGAATHIALVGGATVAALLVLIALTPYSWRAAFSAAPASPGAAFMSKTAAGLGLLGIVGVIWTALPAVLLSACLPPV